MFVYPRPHFHPPPKKSKLVPFHNRVTVPVHRVESPVGQQYFINIKEVSQVHYSFKLCCTANQQLTHSCALASSSSSLV